MSHLLPLGLAGAALAAIATGCGLVDVQTVRGSGEIVTESYDLAGFDRVDVSRGFSLSLQPGAEHGVTIRGDDNVLEHLEVELTGETLRLDVDDGVNLRDVTLEAAVTVPSIEALALHSGAEATMSDPGTSGDLELRLAGGSELVCSGLDAGSLSLDLSGGSELDCSNVTADTVEAELNGGSSVRLAGEIASAQLEGSGASDFDLDRARVAGAEIELSGSSEADLTVSGLLEADLRGSSHVRYRGDPVIGATELAGGSTLEPAP